MRRKSTLAITLAAAMAATAVPAMADDKVSITLFNSKMEVQSQFEEMAEKYAEDNGINIEVYYSNDTVAAHLATKYSSGDPNTLAMVDAKDVYSLAKDHAIDMSDQEWVKNTTMQSN